MLERLEILTGRDNLNNIINKTVMIIGLGGVGGYAVESLVRCGIKNIIIVDYDKIDITNKNRQLIALDSTIDMKKTEVLKNRINDINKDCNVKVLDLFLKASDIDSIINSDIDYVVDACDTISVKMEIIKVCLDKKIKFISCMGTGKRLNPSLLEVTDIRKTNNDPIAKIIRKFVRDNKINKKIPVVCSKEVPLKTDSNKIGSNSFVPASAGLLITSYIINDILKEGVN